MYYGILDTNKDDPADMWKTQPIASRPCQLEDISSDSKNSESLFLDVPNETYEKLKEDIWPNLICITEPLSTYGRASAAKSKLITISFEPFKPCATKNKTNCKTDDEIKTFLSDKMIAVWFNKYSFVSNAYGESTLKKYLWWEYIPYELEQTIHEMRIELTEVNTTDSYLLPRR